MANLIILFPKMVKKSSKIRQVTKFHHQKQTLLVTWKVYGCKRQQGGKKQGKGQTNRKIL
jgi:hypothetical protein